MVTDADERFEALFTANYGDVLAYAVRRCPSRQDAEDVAAETFAVAWRRIHELPDGHQARLWLFGTAHLVRLNQHRGRRRRKSLVERMRRVPRSVASRDAGSQLLERERIEEAFAALTPADREVLQLHVWEQLDVTEIATALGISPAAVWKRLQRARERLAETLDASTRNDARLTSVLVRTVRKAAE